MQRQHLLLLGFVCLPFLLFPLCLVFFFYIQKMENLIGQLDYRWLWWATGGILAAYSEQIYVFTIPTSTHSEHRENLCTVLF